LVSSPSTAWKMDEVFVKVAGFAFHKPTLLKSLFFGKACIIVLLFMYGIRTAIEDGSVKNEPELLRQLIFYPFSLALCFKFCDLIGFRQNDWPRRLLIFAVFYAPMGFLLGKLSGML